MCWEQLPYSPELECDQEQAWFEDRPLPETLVLRAVYRLTGITPVQICSRVRTQRIAAARMLACYLLRQTSDYSTTRIGRVVDRDHSTVIHACQFVAREMAERPMWGRVVAKTQAMLAQE